nr:DEAD/DEAH box helicase [Glaesserella parasuis]
MNITAYQAKYFANEILCRSENGVARISDGLFNAKVDLNPHQIDAALFALKNPLGRGVLLADEVGLGKTVEAGLVLCQLWAERKRRLLVICPAVLRKQWANELAEKFGLPCVILDKSLLKQEYQGSLPSFLQANMGKRVIIISYQYATKLANFLAGELFDCVVMDEAHKLRNAHRTSNKMGQTLRSAFDGRKKLLLTATPLQNSLMELYGLSTLLDEYLFGDEKVFRREFVNEHNMAELKSRLQTVVKRTLRKDVLEYIRYTKRHTLTQNFYPSDEEQALYQAVSDFISKEHSLALPKRQRHLIGLILRKLLASSPYAVADTLSIILKRLYTLKEQQAKQEYLLLDLRE